LLNGHAPLTNTSAPATQVSETVQKQSNVAAEAIAALVLLGIPEQTSAALFQRVPGKTTDEQIRGALKLYAQSKPEIGTGRGVAPIKR
jgi:Holliday junction resolvasome RuvABC DNA-binding subunit